MEATNIFNTKPKEQKTGIKKSFPVTGMTCAACASSVESILSHTDGVNKAIVNFASNSVLVDYDETISEEKLALEKIRMKLLCNTLSSIL